MESTEGTTAAPETTIAEELPLTLAEHESQFGPKAKGAEAAMVAAEVAEAAGGEDVVKEPRKHRAQSQQAGSKDVPRIHALTGRAKAAEERAAALERELADLKKAHAPAAQIARAEARVEQAAPANADPEPDESDQKYAGNYPKYLEDRARWAARDEYLTQQQQAKEAAVKRKREESDTAILKSFREKIDAGKLKYKDFDAIALGPQQLIPNGSVVDAWIMEHRAGADVLYYLSHPTHRQELDSLLTKPVLEQVEDLTLLSQRLLSPPSTQAGQTGAVAGRPMVVLPPKPPTPVRTEAQRAPDGPADMDRELSLSEHEREYGQRRRR